MAFGPVGDTWMICENSARAGMIGKMRRLVADGAEHNFPPAPSDGNG
jgi:hypothetical protein